MQFLNGYTQSLLCKQGMQPQCCLISLAQSLECVHAPHLQSGKCCLLRCGLECVLLARVLREHAEMGMHAWARLL